MDDRQYNAKTEDLNRRMRMIETQSDDFRRHKQELEFISEELDYCNWQSKQLIIDIGYRWPHDRQLHTHIVESMHIADQIINTNTDFYQAGEDAFSNQNKAFYLEVESIEKQRRELNNRATEDSRVDQDFRKGSF